jgi:hypothetical protein
MRGVGAKLGNVEAAKWKDGEATHAHLDEMAVAGDFLNDAGTEGVQGLEGRRARRWRFCACRMSAGVPLGTPDD